VSTTAPPLAPPCSAAFQALQPSYQDADDEAYIYLMNPTGEIVQRDRLRTEITLAPELGVAATAVTAAVMIVVGGLVVDEWGHGQAF
jgi:hypothetical protein